MVWPPCASSFLGGALLGCKDEAFALCVHWKGSSHIVPCHPLLFSMLCVIAGEAGPMKQDRLYEAILSLAVER